MQHKGIEIFYIFFQGILVFQALTFTVLYVLTRRKDLFYYFVFLFLSAAYFFLNAPYTFFDITEDVVWDLWWYVYVNDLLIVIQNLFYLLFLMAFFSNLAPGKKIIKLFRQSLLFIPLLLALFLFLSISKVHYENEIIYYLVQLIPVIPSIIVAYSITKYRLPFAGLVATGLVFNIFGTCLTLLMNILRNYEVHHLFTEGYPLFFVRVGILADMIFLMAAILKKWHFQEKQLSTERLQSQLEAEQLRNKISGELHDDLGSTLSGISMYGYLTSDLLQSGEYEKARQSLAVIQKSAKEMTLNLGDLVWSINPKQDSFETLIERLDQYGTEICAAKNISFKVCYNGDPLKNELSMEARHHIFLFCKEAINNAVKHSQGSLLEIIMSAADGKLEVSVIDNGKGFDAMMVKRGNGLENMQKRADEIGAKLMLTSKKGEGALLTLQCNIT